MTALGLGYSALPELVYGAGPTRPEFTPSVRGEAHVGGFDKFMGRLLIFIPGDVVGGYTALIAVTPSNIWAQSLVALGFFILAPLLVYLGFGRKAKLADADLSVEPLPWFRIIAAPAAFLTWVIGLPQSPVDALYKSGFLKLAVLIFGAIIISALAGKYDKASQSPS
jgi:hypothetical protein